MGMFAGLFLGRRLVAYFLFGFDIPHYTRRPSSRSSDVHTLMNTIFFWSKTKLVSFELWGIYAKQHDRPGLGICIKKSYLRLMVRYERRIALQFC
jgi:hypothetical protein